MSLQTRLAALATALGTDVKALNTADSAHAALKEGVHGIPEDMGFGQGLVWDGSGWIAADLITQTDLDDTFATAEESWSFADVYGFLSGAFSLTLAPFGSFDGVNNVLHVTGDPGAFSIDVANKLLTVRDAGVYTVTATIETTSGKWARIGDQGPDPHFLQPACFADSGGYISLSYTGYLGAGAALAVKCNDVAGIIHTFGIARASGPRGALGPVGPSGPSGGVFVGPNAPDPATALLWIDIDESERVWPPPVLNEFPGNPYTGQEVYIRCTTTPFSLWHFRYDPGWLDGYPWEFLGGVAQKAEVDGSDTINSAAYINAPTNPGPTITVPFAGIYDCEYGMNGITSPVAGAYVLASPCWNNGVADDGNLIQVNTGAALALASSVSRRRTLVAPSASAELRLKYRQGVAAAGASVRWRWISVTPIRVKA